MRAKQVRHAGNGANQTFSAAALGATENARLENGAQKCY